MKSNFEIGSYQLARFHALGPHLVELPGAGRLRIQVAVELGEMCAPGGSVGLVLAHIFLAELDGELNSSALVLSELSFRPPTLSFQDLAKLPFLPLSLSALPRIRLRYAYQAEFRPDREAVQRCNRRGWGSRTRSSRRCPHRTSGTRR